MEVRDVMTESVFTVDPAAPVREAARIMRDEAVGFLPVQGGVDSVVEGVVTDRDLVVRCLAEGLDANTTPVQAVMTPKAFSCYDDDTVLEAARVMRRHGVRRVLVLERATDRLIGIVSLADIAARTDDPEVAAMIAHDVTLRRDG